MTSRVCRDCPTLIPAGTRSGLCPTCSRTADAARGRRQARGYDADYDAARRDWQRRLDQGATVRCWRCDELGRPHLIHPRHWALGHCDNDRTVLHGPECPEGNNAVAGRTTCPHRSHSRTP